MRHLIFKTPLGRLTMLALLPLGVGGFASGVVSADICQAYESGSIGASLDSRRPIICP